MKLAFQFFFKNFRCCLGCRATSNKMSTTPLSPSSTGLRTNNRLEYRIQLDFDEVEDVFTLVALKI